MQDKTKEQLIHELNTHEDSLNESAIKLKAIFETVICGIIIINEHGFIDSFNPAAEKMFGYSMKEVVGKNVNILMPSPYREKHDQYIKNYVHTGEKKIIGNVCEVIAKRKDGTIFSVNISVSETWFNEKRIFTCIIDDITQKKQAEERLAKTNKVYSYFVPHEFLETLGKKDITEMEFGDHIEKNMTILFSDIRGFTSFSETMTPQEIFSFLNSYFRRMEPIVREHNGMIDKYIGDSIMALFSESATDAVNTAIAMHQELLQFNQELKRNNAMPIYVGIGLNTGKLLLGTIGGVNRMEGTVIGDSVNLASRIESMTKIFGTPLLITEHTFHKLDDPTHYCIRFIDRVKPKGKSQPVSVYEVFDIDTIEMQESKLATKKRFEEAVSLYHFKKIDQASELFQQCLTTTPNDTAAKIYLQRCHDFLDTKYYDGLKEVTKTFQWSKDLETGISFIDEQHQELFQRINHLVQAIKLSIGQEKMNEVIEFLDEYIAKHFSEEEEFMQQYEYPGYSVHKALHIKFVEDFHYLKREIYQKKEKSLYLVLRVQVLITEWLTNHITKVDKLFALFVKDQL